MADLEAKKDIENISLDILRKSKSLDQFPTPVEKIIQYTELRIDKNVDLSSIQPGFGYKMSNKISHVLSKVRGVFDFSEKIIYVDLSQSSVKQNFVKLHEAGHGVLPWQIGTHDILQDDDHSLSANANEEFEQEANYFASITLFQHDRFFDELNTLPLGIGASLHLSKHFGASIHAALRRYVEVSSKKCALFVLENIATDGNSRSCGIKDFFVSPNFDKSFGNLILPSNPNKLPFFIDFYIKRKLKTDGSVELETQNGSVKYNYHFFFNGYNAFVLLFPVGEKQRSRTKIIISETNL